MHKTEVGSCVSMHIAEFAKPNYKSFFMDVSRFYWPLCMQIDRQRASKITS